MNLINIIHSYHWNNFSFTFSLNISVFSKYFADKLLLLSNLGENAYKQ